MSDVHLALATADDDAGIRRLLATNPMPGRIRLRFEREPDYFAGCAAMMGTSTQVLVARDRERVVGVACRAIRKMHVNGVAEDVAYLGELRVDRAYRGRLLTARGFAMMRELHAERPARVTVTTIINGNSEAEGVLLRRRRRVMPRYRFVDTLHTLAIPAARRAPNGSPATVDRGLAASFFREQGARRNLFPAYEPAGDVVAVDCAMAALVDQRAYKQTVVDGYDAALRMVRRLYNLVAPIKLPRPGSILRHAAVTHFCAAGDDLGAARALIEQLRRVAAARGLDHILLPFSGRDPLLAAARTFRPLEYLSSIYTVAWNDGDDLHDRLDARPLALDIATL